MTIGERIKELRGKVTRHEFAEMLSASRSTIQRYENNEGVPDTDFVKALCEQYRVSADWLIFGRDAEYMGEQEPQKTAPLDMAVLIDAIDTIEQTLQTTGRTMAPGDKAEIIAKIYELFMDDEQGSSKEKMYNILKLVA